MKLAKKCKKNTSVYTLSPLDKNILTTAGAIIFSLKQEKRLRSCETQQATKQ